MKTFKLLLAAILISIVGKSQTYTVLESQHDLEALVASLNNDSLLFANIELNSMYVTDSTQRIHDLSSLSTFKEMSLVRITNTDITSLNDLAALKKIYGLSISENNKLTDLNKLNELELLESFYLTNQPNIKHVTIELDTAKSVNTTVESPLYRFISNPDLETIEVSFKVEKNSNTGFIFSATSNPKLRTIRLFSGGERLHFDKLEIESNAKLEEVLVETVFDFTKVYSIEILDNPVLTNFYTRALLGGASSNYPIIVKDNNSLGNLCPIQEAIRVTDSITPNNPHLVIQNNAPGANSVAEVLAANCDYLVNSVQEEAKAEPMLLYPNPAQTSFSIFGANSQTPVLIYNSLGMLVQQTQGNEIPIYKLPSGLYIVQWQNNLGAYQSQRLVKE